MKHIMVDLETFDTKHSAVVTAIGAVEFDPNTGNLGKEFHMRLDGELQQLLGRTINASTVYFWLNQPDAARLALLANKREPRDVIESFSGFWKNVSQKNYFWSHATFDSVVLRDLYETYKFPTPWHYRDVMDIRTLVALLPKPVRKECFKLPRDGEHHNALDDAKYQAKYVSKAWQYLYKED